MTILRALGRCLIALLPLALIAGQAPAQTSAQWEGIAARAKGQTVYFNAWAGDEKTNAFIAWAGQELKARHGVNVVHVRLKDTAEAVTRVIAEKTAGRDSDGTVDLVWINGPNFLAMKSQGLLYGPVAQLLPNFRYVDTTAKRSNVIDFTTPVDGYAVPWRLAQIVFIYDSARIRDAKDVPRSAAALLAWARNNPGRLTHPNPSNFLGATFLKQVLYELAADVGAFQQAATDESFARLSAPLWPWYDALRPHLWRQGQQFPENGSAQRQLLNDGEIDITLSFTPAEAAVSVLSGKLPASVRSFTFSKGTIGNTSFVAIPYNSRAKEGAMLLANFLLEPATQARAQDVQQIGSINVLDAGKLSAAQRALFGALTPSAALPTAAELGIPQLEPHASWMSRLTAEWQRRYSR
ncbi:MAG: ABC transporter substrate-binding protein [Burkholderiaceae bacterium]